MKKIITKSLLSFVLALVMLSSTISFPALAANSSLHLILGVGRTSAIVQSNTDVKIEAIEKSNNANSQFAVPLVDNGSTYVPFRYIMESAGFTITFESATDNIVIKARNGNFPVWLEDSVKGARKVTATKIDYKNDVFTITVQGSKKTEKIKIAPSKSYFGRTYIPIRELERLEFIIHWDGIYNMVHVISDTSNAFKTAFEDIFKESDASFKGAKSSTYLNSMQKNDSFYESYENYMAYGTDYSNYTNNSLALKTPDGLFISTVKDSLKNEFTAISSGSRQLTYTAANGKKMIYYIGKRDRAIYKVEITSKDRSGNLTLGTPSKVVLPKTLQGKYFSQLIINYDRIFFVAYDTAKDGGNVYMARVGDEEKTAIKLTKDKVWNIALTSDYNLCYTNFDKSCYLYAIDLKAVSNLTKLHDDKATGLEGTVVLKAGIQSIAFSQKENGIFYYTDISTGAIMSYNNGTSKQLVKPATTNVLSNFLNLYEGSDDKLLYYIEYANGRANSFDSCKIMVYDLYTDEIKTAYISDKQIMQLTIVGKSIYFTNSDYSKLYKLDVSDNGYAYTEF